MAKLILILEIISLAGVVPVEVGLSNGHFLKQLVHIIFLLLLTECLVFTFVSLRGCSMFWLEYLDLYGIRGGNPCMILLKETTDQTKMM